MRMQYYVHVLCAHQSHGIKDTTRDTCSSPWSSPHHPLVPLLILLTRVPSQDPRTPQILSWVPTHDVILCLEIEYYY